MAEIWMNALLSMSKDEVQAVQRAVAKYRKHIPASHPDVAVLNGVQASLRFAVASIENREQTMVDSNNEAPF